MVTDVYFPRINGVSTSIETFRQSLKSENVEVRIVAPQYFNEPTIDGIERVPGWAVPGDKEDRLASWPRMVKTVEAAAKGCDLIHIQTPFLAHYAGLRVARRLGLPVISTYHTLFEEYLHHYARFLPSRWLKRQARNFSQRQCNALDAVVVPSSAMQSRLLEYGVTKPIHVLPTGIPLDQFAHGNRAAFRARHNIAPDRPVALYVGRVAHEKNIDFLLEAMVTARQLCADSLLIIAGEGPAMTALEHKVHALKLEANVLFIGYLDRKTALPDCYAGADVFVFASKTETQGLVLLEAMAAGLPVIALAKMGTVDILSPGLGALTPPDDSLAFGTTLGQFFNRPNEWKSLAESARAYAATWSDGAMATRLANCYRALVARPN